MPYLPTSQAFLEQSSQLLEAYPDDTRITTKYSYPPHLPSSTKSSKKSSRPVDGSADHEAAQGQTPTISTAPIATLTLKTYHPASGICLKYRTNKAAEVGRLISGLGKLASGAKVSDLGTTTGAPAGGEVEMTDAPVPAPATADEHATTSSKAETTGKGGKSKKKSGKGKR